MDLGLAGRRALVCGASRGMGRGIAARLHEEGATVVLVARSADGLAAVARDLSALRDAPVAWVAADLTTEAGRHAAFEACPAPDILVNNGGGLPPGHYTDWDRAAWQAAFDLMLLPAVEMIRLQAPGMAERGYGRIINILSRSVKSPHAPLGLSTAVRTGVAAYCASMARELIGHGVTVNNILPGIIDSDAQHTHIASLATASGRDVADIRAARAAANPAGRFGSVEEISAAVAYFASALAGFVTNQNLLVDGGDFAGTF